MAATGEHPPTHEQHTVSYASYLLIWLGLISLTAITVAVAGIDLGRWVIITALSIASIKTLLVLGHLHAPEVRGPGIPPLLGRRPIDADNFHRSHIL